MAEHIWERLDPMVARWKKFTGPDDAERLAVQIIDGGGQKQEKRDDPNQARDFHGVTNPKLPMLRP